MVDCSRFDGGWNGLVLVDTLFIVQYHQGRMMIPSKESAMIFATGGGGESNVEG